MKIVLMSLLVTTLSLHPSEEPTPSAPAAGALIVAGGGSIPPDLRPRALKMAGGSGAGILIVPWASARENAGSSTRDAWIESGAEQVSIIPEDADAARIAVEQADLIWLVGGDQSRLMEAFRQRGLIEVMRKSHAGGTIVAGTSAGAAVMSRHMLTGKAELEGLIAGSTELIEGLGLWKGVIVDQHFLARRRWSRLFTAVASHPDEVGIGIDERTAVIVVPGSPWEVIGAGPVIVIDGRKSQHVEKEQGAMLKMQDLRVHMIGSGQSWNLHEKASSH